MCGRTSEGVHHRHPPQRLRADVEHELSQRSVYIRAHSCEQRDTLLFIGDYVYETTAAVQSPSASGSPRAAVFTDPASALPLGTSAGERRDTVYLTMELLHGKSLAESSRMAHHFGLDVPKAPTPSQRWELQILGTLSGPAFDQWYSRLEVADHHQDITDTTGIQRE